MIIGERLVVVLDDFRRGMSIARQGIWLCPECGNYEPWKSRDPDTNHIDENAVIATKELDSHLIALTQGRGGKGTITSGKEILQLISNR